MTTFKPRAGSVGERALDYLAKHGRTLGQKLADEIDCERGSLHSCMNLCVVNELVTRTVEGAGQHQQTWYDLYRAELPAEDVAEVSPPAPPPAADVTRTEVAPAPSVVVPGPGVVTVDATPAEIPVFAKSQPIVNPGEPFDWTTSAVKPEAQPIGRQVTEAIAQQLANSADKAMQSDLPGDADLIGIPNPVQTRRAAEAVASSTRLDISPAAKALIDMHGTPRERPAEPKPGVKTTRRHFDFGLFKSGRLQIEVGEGTEVLDRDETEALYEFFIKIHLAGGMS